MEINNFFSKPDLGNVDPEVFRASLEMINLKNKIEEFREYLKQYCYQEDEGFIPPWNILLRFDKDFGINKDGKI